MSKPGEKSTQQKLIFFAYQGRNKGYADDNVESIRAAIKTYNQYQKTYLCKSWEEYRKSTDISKEILGAIDDCEVFVCDLTYLNHNVLFELGYAIAKNKHILILVNEKVVLKENLGTAGNAYSNFIFKGIRYKPIINHKCIHQALQNGDFEKELLNKLVNAKNITPRSSDILYIVSKITNQPSLDLTTFILEFKDEKQLTLESDDTTEVKFQPLSWYFQNLLKAKVVMIHFLGENIENSFLENAKNSFYAGFGCGRGCDVFLVAPAKYRPPLDYHEILVTYETSNELIDCAIDWLDNKFKIVPPARQVREEDHEINLIELGIGCDVAENERQELLKYFVYTSSYQAAINYQKSIIAGRKGSGKTAIYIKLSEELPTNPYNYVVRLQPESEELLEDVNLAQLYDASRRSFFVAVWRLVIFSKLAHAISERLKLNPHAGYSDFEKEIIFFVEENQEFIKLNFFGVIREINRRVNNSSHVSSPDIMQSLFNQYLSPLTRILRKYVESVREQYFKIIILADNLDKTWDSKNDLSIQAEMILTLLEIENKIKNELIINESSRIEIKQIIFLREDIFDYIRNQSIEPDKLTSMVHTIDWEKYPNQLQELIENRFIHILKLKNRDEIEKKAWREFFQFKEKKHPYELILEIITKRPRDLLYFVARLFESAIDRDHDKVENEDLKYAIVSYTEFLNKNLIAETRAEFPEIADILSKLESYRGEKIEYSTFKKILAEFKYGATRQKELLEVLFNKGYMLGYDDKTNKPFSEIDVLNRKLREKRFFGLLRNKVYLIAHAKYYFIKNKSFSPF